MRSLPEIGSEVRYIGRPDGERSVGEALDPKQVYFGLGGRGTEPDAAWMLGGCRGRVATLHPGSRSVGRCPNHDEFPGCICANETGIDRGIEPWAVVEWETDHKGRTIKRCIELEDEGDTWERVE